MSDFFAQLSHRRLSADEKQATAPKTAQANALLPDSAAPQAETGTQADPVLDTRTLDQRSALLRMRSIEALAETGMFDVAYYLEAYPDIAQAGVNPLEHFFDSGFQEGRRPNPYFDPQWYLETYPDVKEAGMQPLLHYALHGDLEGRRPSQYFDTPWYRSQYEIPEKERALSHYLSNRKTGRFSPIPDFDAEYYARHNPDVIAAAIDPFEHFIYNGFREGRNPSEEFDVKFYVQRYLRGSMTENPFLHWLAHKHEPGVHGRVPEDEATIPREVKRFTKPGPYFEEYRPLPAGVLRQAKVLAYYLPQFHAFPENNTWWGNGFTEWTNCARALPRFKDHYQPRIPRDLGFYCLDSNEPFRRQADMAKQGGVDGFIFYYYWFNGKRLMDQPIERFLADESIDMPFCLMWANENWTRRWDGFESEVLISQDYRLDDDERMAAEFARHFRDPRYIRTASGRPLLMVYRPRLIPDAVEAIARWRTVFRERFGENPVLIMAQGFGDTDPTIFGLDGAIEFPPHKLAAGMEGIGKDLEILDPEFSAQVVRYDDVVTRSIEEVEPAFPLIKCAIPSWDNDARRQGGGMVIHGSTPAKYEAWLSRLVEMTGERPFFGDRIVCVNAWNEWAEGAYLEPDLHFGAAYLNATGRAVSGLSQGAEGQSKIVLVGHDAHPHGAQELLLNIGRTLLQRFGVEIEFLLLEGGPLEKAYAEIAPVAVASSKVDLKSRFASLRERGFANAIVNTTAAAHCVKQAAEAGMSCIALVHELPRIIRENKLGPGALTALRHARSVIFPAAFVRDEVLRALDAGVPKAKILIQPQGIYKVIEQSEQGAAWVRHKLGMAQDERLVLGVGYADLRKGFDLFLQLWRLLRAESGPRVHFCWLGGLDHSLKEWLAQELEDMTAEGSFHLPGFTDNVAAFFSAADVFALTSREDPFPSVALEALSAGVPVVAFDRAGGIAGLLKEHGVGIAVPYGDLTAMAGALSAALHQNPSIEDREMRRTLMANQFDWAVYVRHLLDIALPGVPSVSVAVPNYNYARYMPSRLGSIFGQSHPVQEVVVLDDCSKDDSLSVIPAVAADWKREIRLLPNKVNSGSVFAQWRKAAEVSQGEFVWIAEADDLSDPKFLTRLLEPLHADPSVRFAFSDSKAIGNDNVLLGSTYKPYYATVEPGALTRSEVFEAREFAGRFLAVKNLILNVSAVVWRRDALLRALDACEQELRQYKMAGDWRLYLEALAEPEARIAYEAEALNVHRRHAQSVTHALDADRHVAEIAQCHKFSQITFGFGKEVQMRQDTYLQEVMVQLKGRGDSANALTPQAKDQALSKIAEKGSKNRKNSHKKQNTTT
jgi:hypothetical protein